MQNVMLERTRVKKMGVTQYVEQLPSAVLIAECGTVYRSQLRHPRHAGGIVRIPKSWPSILQFYINSNSQFKKRQMKNIVYCKALKISNNLQKNVYGIPI